MSKLLMFSDIYLLRSIFISLGTLHFKFGVLKSFFEGLGEVKSFWGVYNDWGLKYTLWATVANILISLYLNMYIEMLMICI